MLCFFKQFGEGGQANTFAGDWGGDIQDRHTGESPVLFGLVERQTGHKLLSYMCSAHVAANMFLGTSVFSDLA